MAKIAIIVGRTHDHEHRREAGDDSGDRRGREGEFGKGTKYTDARVHVLRKVLTAPRTSD